MVNSYFIATAGLAVLASAVTATPNDSGDCVSARYTFPEGRVVRVAAGAVVPPAPPLPSGYDTTNTDWTIVGGNIDFNSDESLNLYLDKQASGPALGSKVSSTRYILYGKISAKLKAIPSAGACTTFITMSDRHDEIDWEIVGYDTTHAQTNVFYKNITEFSIHSSTEKLPTGTVSDDGGHLYTFDWKHDSLTWGMDGVALRTLNKNTSTSPLTPAGERWFPQTPSLIQFAVWDAGSSDSPGTVTWAGGAIPWGSQSRLGATYEYIDVQCYDDSDNPVAAWPPVSSANPARVATPNRTASVTRNQNQTTRKSSSDDPNVDYGTNAASTAVANVLYTSAALVLGAFLSVLM